MDKKLWQGLFCSFGSNQASQIYFSTEVSLCQSGTWPPPAPNTPDRPVVAMEIYGNCPQLQHVHTILWVLNPRRPPFLPASLPAISVKKKKTLKAQLRVKQQPPFFFSFFFTASGHSYQSLHSAEQRQAWKLRTTAKGGGRKRKITERERGKARAAERKKNPGGLCFYLPQKKLLAVGKTQDECLADWHQTVESSGRSLRVYWTHWRMFHRQRRE